MFSGDKLSIRSFNLFVSKHERILEWMCFSEKVDQALVISFTTD